MNPELQRRLEQVNAFGNRYAGLLALVGTAASVAFMLLRRR